MAPVGAGRLAICVFAKPPRAGQAKTRLARDLGVEEAARLAHAFFLDAWSKVAALDWARPVLATTDVHDEAWAGVTRADLWSQGSGDLGQRMERVLRRALDTHEAAIAVGTDTPLLPGSWFDLARMALRAHDAVVGPTEDGGFYLLGLRRCPPGMLDGIRWSTGAARAQTVAGLKRAGLTVTELPELFDIDHPADVTRLRGKGAVLRRRAPRTAQVLDELADRVRASPA
jgi:hypothetical protein